MSALAIVGSRFVNHDSEDSYKLIEKEVLQLERSTGISFKTIVSGGAKGIDKIAEKFAERHRRAMLVFEPNYSKYPSRQAPIIRNTQIVDHANYMLAYPKGRSPGTRDSIRKARAAGLHVIVRELSE